ncbi:hypothetical protein C8A03DRAFT_42489 [Achaetomium macrosporum]|uniref:Peptidase M20 dimerisation domain-containing protein n=1 Tax=Achaetomium macrosporum TaxID=79813 RepID=A0AAN7CF44_9PEZI|nr:hypothetical protein C8A03DRAFT_42489 [Achaetomium macrosporum]
MRVPHGVSLLSAALALGSHVLATDFSDLSSHLQAISADIVPDLKAIAVDIWNHPELGRSEFHAHDLIVDYFTTQRPGEWTVTPHAYPGLPTSWRLEFEFRAPGTPPDQALPVIGFLAEYDALVQIGHACGHNHIAMLGLAVSGMVRRAIIELGISARVVVVGTPDEEGEAGKHDLLLAGAFDGIDIWFMAHPTSTSAIQPMNSRINAVGQFRRDTHADVVRTAYEALVAVRDRAAAGLPGTASSVNAVEDVGMFASNVVQSQISLGFNGTSLETVQQTVSSILDSTYPGVTFTVGNDETVPGGVNLTVFGPGGHASESTKSPLVLTIETFRALSTQESISFYLPGNTTCTVLDITWDLRTRYTQDLSSVLAPVSAEIQTRAAAIVTDTIYPSLEVTPVLPDIFLDLIKQPEYFGPSNSWKLSTVAPASTDASWLQNAVLNPETHALIGADRVVFHPNYGICEPGGSCAFNHEPGFREVAGTDYSYIQTEIVARALADIAMLKMDSGSLDA